MIATDAHGYPVALRHYRVVAGIDGLAGKWCVIKVERTLFTDGDVASVRRTVHSVYDTHAEAEEAAALAAQWTRILG
jgi:hypothetical protein